MKTTSLITGGAGFIGSSIADKLLELGHDIVIVDDLSTGQLQNIPKEAKFVALDIGQSDALKKLTQLFREHSIDYIFHCAYGTGRPHGYVPRTGPHPKY